MPRSGFKQKARTLANLGSATSPEQELAINTLGWAASALNAVSGDRLRDLQRTRLHRQIDDCLDNPDFYRRRLCHALVAIGEASD